MGTAAKTTKKAHSASVTRAGSQKSSFFRAAGSTGFFSPLPRPASSAPVIQARLSVSKPADPLELEADRTAEKVMRTPASQLPGPAAAPAGTGRPPGLTADPERQVLRFGEGTPTVAADARSEIQHATTGGQALTPEVRAFMEPRLGADLGDVRVHADESAHSLSNHLSARAFTHRNHIFFGRDQYQPGTDAGRSLLAHELTHTIQQGAMVQRSIQPEVSASATPPAVQRFGLQNVLDYLADKAYYIPGFRLLTLLIGFNPVNMRSADRSAANFLRALIELVPGGALITRVLDNHGVITKAAAWVEQKAAALGDIGSQVVAGLRRFIDSLGWTDILHPGDVWDRAKRIFTDPIGRLTAFGAGVVSELLSLVKEAILRPLAALAEGTRGYDLLKAILGQDPVTGDQVPRTPDALIGGFMKLIGQEEIWQNIKRGNAVGRAFAWFQGALAGLMGFVRSIPQRIVQAVRSLTFPDVITVVDAFRKIASAFLGLAAQFGTWAARQVLSLLEILVAVVAPGVMPYIAKAKEAFHTIIRDPVRFIGNLVRAGKLGFQKFAGNIVSHLKTALIKWITGPLGEAGVYIPASFSLLEIVKLILSVLGLTWQNIRTKLLKIIPDPVLTALEKTASILVTLVTQGPAAAWEQIKGELTELKDQLVGQVTQMIQSEVVKAAVTKLASMLNPAGAVIQAIVAIYNTVMFFVDKARQIGAVVASFIDSIAAIAAGQVEGAASRVEQTLASTLTVVIAFLARFAGLGGIPDKLVGIVKRIRQPIDRGLDKIVAWLGAMLDKLKAAFGGDVRTTAEKERDVQLAKNDAESALAEPGATPTQVQARLPAIKSKYKLTSIALEQLAGGQFDVLVVINPAVKTEPKPLAGVSELPKELVVGIYVKVSDQVWKVHSIGQQYIVLSHATNVNDTKKFISAIFVVKFKEGQFPPPSAEELQNLQAIDSNWPNKISGKPQTTGTSGHAKLMEEKGRFFAQMLTVKRVFLDRQYRLVTTLLANGVGQFRRADIVIEHVSGRIDVIEVQSKSDDEADLYARNWEAIRRLPLDIRGNVLVIQIPGTQYPKRGSK